MCILNWLLLYIFLFLTFRCWIKVILDLILIFGGSYTISLRNCNFFILLNNLRYGIRFSATLISFEVDAANIRPSGFDHGPHYIVVQLIDRLLIVKRVFRQLLPPPLLSLVHINETLYFFRRKYWVQI